VTTADVPSTGDGRVAPGSAWPPYPVGMSVAVVSEPWAVARRPLSRAMYDVLVEAGAYRGQPVELIEGDVVEMAPQGPRHGNTVGHVTTRLAARLVARFGERYLVRPQTPLAAGVYSEPEPDLAVVDWDASTDDAHPATAHLVIEVAETSHRKDLVVKSRIYAGAGVAQYWVVDLPANEVVVHADPVAEDRSSGRPALYGVVRRLPWEAELEVLGLTVRPSELF
jgi:Uma2 family endonuclease